jgi:hypothetical protein
MGVGLRRLSAGSISALALVALSGMSLGPTSAAADSSSPPTRLKVTAASIGDRSLMLPTRDNPIVMNPKVKQQLSITLENDGTDAVAVRYLRLTGRIMGVQFVRYQAEANVVVDPGKSHTISVLGDFFDVDGRSTGYMSATMQVVDEQRALLASQPFVADVRGKVVSSEGWLLLEVGVFGLVSVFEIVLGLARRRLPRNRFVRAIMFTLGAASVVIALTVAAAMARVALFGASSWVPALLIASGIGFVLGYLSPGRVERGARDSTDESVIDLVAAEAVARASGGVTRIQTGELESHKSGDHTTGIAAALRRRTGRTHDSGSHSPAQHDSGGHTPAQHDSGGHTPAQHDSGGHAPAQHDSGGFTPPPPHESGGHEPVQ